MRNATTNSRARIFFVLDECASYALRTYNTDLHSLSSNVNEITCEQFN